MCQMKLERELVTLKAFVKHNTGEVGMNALEYLIKKWLIPKHLVGQEKIEEEASMIHLFHQEFGSVIIFCLHVTSLF